MMNGFKIVHFLYIFYEKSRMDLIDNYQMSAAQHIDENWALPEF